MKQESYELFEQADLETIINTITNELKQKNESPFWADKVEPFSKAVLSVLIPLREQDLLFNPEGEYQKSLTPELFFRWCDFVSLKTLAFTINYSNEQNKLVRTKIPEEKAKNYKIIDISTLASYLAMYNVDLKDELKDFPIANYNLHIGVSNVIKSLL
jgi:hypothetical protein